ncbi:pectate lyase family protein [Catalinimonas niigatensis]|uniref:pectate lyase family protein n=1 Tax=Catalinimonas niigatensis TaxID=1397264 RepID=UPI002664F2DA|nr:pectate lyase [Catalinimonas niigatensis]WPP53324.1 pectate lyase [Catalinimonas niigatensis]
MLTFTRALVLLYLTFTYSLAQIPSFPGAEGFGSTTIGGRGGKVIKVTNLNDNGPGSLRAALKEKGPRIIIFTTGGIIDLENKLIVQEPFVTIAGQTAPGSGICIRGEGIEIDTHDVIIRYLRVRPGDIDFGPTNVWNHVDAISIGGPSQNTYNVVIDHCSFSWSVDENMDFWYNTHDVTVQNSIISEALNRSKHPKGEHGMGILVGGGATKISMHHNLIAHNPQRSPRLNSDKLEFDFINNIIYNPGGSSTDIGDTYHKLNYQHINYIGNYIIMGKNTQRASEIIARRFKDQIPPLSIYIENNIGFRNYPDNWTMLKDLYGQPIEESVRATEPFPFPPVEILSPQTAYEIVLSHAGVTRPFRDPVDRKIINDVRNNLGETVNVKDHVLQWPPLDVGYPPLDSDDDGMPDAWEESYQLNPNSKDDAQDYDNDGYTNIEEYLNNTNPLVKQSGITPLSFFNISPLHDDSLPFIPFELEQNYPNPFQKDTKINFSISEASFVSLSVVNSQGMKIATLLDRFLYEGNYEVVWDGMGFDPNIYFLILTSDGRSRLIKSILINN